MKINYTYEEYRNVLSEQKRIILLSTESRKKCFKRSFDWILQHWEDKQFILDPKRGQCQINENFMWYSHYFKWKYPLDNFDNEYLPTRQKDNFPHYDALIQELFHRYILPYIYIDRKSLNQEDQKKYDWALEKYYQYKGLKRKSIEQEIKDARRDSQIDKMKKYLFKNDSYSSKYRKQTLPQFKVVNWKVSQEPLEYSYVYAIVINNKISYIGCTQRKINERLQQHIYCVEKKLDDSVNKLLYQAMRQNGYRFKILFEGKGVVNRTQLEAMQCGFIQMFKPIYNREGINQNYKFSINKDFKVYSGKWYQDRLKEEVF